MDAPGSSGKLASVCNACSAATSVVCMGSMGAALAAAGAGGAAGMAGMAGMASGGPTPLATQLLAAIGLGALNQIPDAILRPVFIALLLVTAYSAYRAYCASAWLGAYALGAYALTLASGLALYGAIYLWMSDALYYLAFGGMLVASASSLIATRARPSSSRVAAAS